MNPFKKKKSPDPPLQEPRTLQEVQAAIQVIKRLVISPQDQTILDEAATQSDAAGRAARAFAKELEEKAAALTQRQEALRAKVKGQREAAEKNEAEKEKRKKGKS